MSLARALWTPKDSAAAAPPRSARIARPVRESSRLYVASAASSTATQITKYIAAGSGKLTEPMASGGMPVMPSWRPSMSMLPNR